MARAQTRPAGEERKRPARSEERFRVRITFANVDDEALSAQVDALMARILFGERR